MRKEPFGLHRRFTVIAGGDDRIPCPYGRIVTQIIVRATVRLEADGSETDEPARGGRSVRSVKAISVTLDPGDRLIREIEVHAAQSIIPLGIVHKDGLVVFRGKGSLCVDHLQNDVFFEFAKIQTRLRDQNVADAAALTDGYAGGADKGDVSALRFCKQSDAVVILNLSSCFRLFFVQFFTGRSIQVYSLSIRICNSSTVI